MTITKEQLEQAAKAAGLTGKWIKTFGGWDALDVEGESFCFWQPHHDHGQLLDLAMACKIGLDPMANHIAYSIGSKVFVEIVNCQDFPALAEAVILACCEQFDAKGGE